VLLHDLDQVDLGLDLGEGVIGRWGGHHSYCRAHCQSVRNEGLITNLDALRAVSYAAVEFMDEQTGQPIVWVGLFGVVLGILLIAHSAIRRGGGIRKIREDCGGGWIAFLSCLIKQMWAAVKGDREATFGLVIAILGLALVVIGYLGPTLAERGEPSASPTPKATP
jgi:hypothetical protein